MGKVRLPAFEDLPARVRRASNASAHLRSRCTLRHPGTKEGEARTQGEQAVLNSSYLQLPPVCCSRRRVLACLHQNHDGRKPKG